jgi:hypothetical protein
VRQCSGTIAWRCGSARVRSTYVGAGTDELAQVRLYLAGLVLADVQPGADSPDAGQAAGCEVLGEHLGGGLPVAVQPGKRPGYTGYTLGGAAADDQHEQLVRPDQRQRGPRGDHGADRPEPQPGRDVRGEGGTDPAGKQPPRQAGCAGTAARGVE